MGFVCRLLSALMLVAAFARLAHADPFHQQTVPLGERALGMGGAFTGVANDPSAAFYNPAGIALLEDSALSASLTVNAFDRHTVEDGYRGAGGSVDLTHRSQPTLPVFVSLVKQVGRRDAQRQRKHAVALSTFTVDQRRLQFDVTLRNADDQGRGVVKNLRIETEESTIWHGGTYAYRVSPSLALGLSGFLSLSRSRYAQNETTVTLGAFNADQNTYENPTVSVDDRVATSDVKAIVLRIGGWYAARPDLALGLMLQPPGIPLSGNGTIRDRRVFSDALSDPPYGTYFDPGKAKVSAALPTPWTLRAGVSYQPRPHITLSADGALYGGSGTRRDPVRALGDAPIDPVTGGTPTAGEYVATSWYRRVSGNASLGMESTIRDKVVVRSGVFTDLSSAPSIDRPTDVYSPADIDRFGAALSVGIVASGYDVSIGAAGLYGRGDALAYNTNVADDPSDPAYFSYVPTRVTDQTVFVFISGAKRAAQRLAKQTYKKVEDRLREEPEAIDAAAPAEPKPVESAPAPPVAAPMEPESVP